MNNRRLSLQSLLALDAATCAAMGGALLLGADAISGVTQIPESLLFWAGASLMPVAALMAISSRAMPVPGWAAALVVLGNLLWIMASIVLPLAGLIAPNPLGWAFLIGQAVIVAIVTSLEFNASRSSAAATQPAR